MTVNKLAVHLMVFSLIFIEGCIILPVGHNTLGKEIRDEDLAFIELGVTTKNDIVERFGEQYVFLEEHKVIAYHWTSATEFMWIVIGPGVGADFGHAGTYRQGYAVYVLFDSDGHVKRFQRMQLPDKGLSVEEWLDRE